MTTTDRAPEATLDGWRRDRFEAVGIAHDRFTRGEGPAVVLVPEIPGASPEVLGLGEHLVESGFRVVIPSPFGEPGRAPGGAATLGIVARLCISREFRAFAVNADRPFTAWLRALAADVASDSPGGRVGVIGMCFTGSFALAAAVEPSVVAAVASQPAVPFPLGAARRRSPGVSAAELTGVARRAADGDVCALGLRFTRDRAVPSERFATLRRRLGDAFEVIELDSGPGNPDGFSAGAHAVLTHEVRIDPPNAAAIARDRVTAFLADRLGVASAQ